MSCEEVRLARIDDDPAELVRFESHAADCADCARLLRDDRRLAGAVGRWRSLTPPPPVRLERRVVEAMERQQAERESGKVVPIRRVEGAPTSGWRRWGRVAAAALLVAATGVVFNQLRPPDTDLERAVLEVEESEHRLARAIAKLEREALPVLEQAGDPAVPAERAEILLRYGDRLRHLDSVIAEVQGFLADNPGQSRGHTVLLAAYKEKDELLREVIRLPLGEKS